MGLGCSRQRSTTDVVVQRADRIRYNRQVHPNEFSFIITSRDPTPIFVNNRYRPRTRDTSNNEIILQTLDRLFSDLIEIRINGLRNEIRDEFTETTLDCDIDSSCSICLEKFKKGEVTTKLTCDHLFHKNCIDNWFLRQSTCPLCNRNFNN